MDCCWWKHQVKITKEKEKAPVLRSSSKVGHLMETQQTKYSKVHPTGKGGRSAFSSSRKFAVVSSSLSKVPLLSLYSLFSQYSWELAMADVTLSLQRSMLSLGGLVTSPLSDNRSSPLAISMTGPGPSAWEKGVGGCLARLPRTHTLKIMTVWCQGPPCLPPHSSG